MKSGNSRKARRIGGQSVEAVVSKLVIFLLLMVAALGVMFGVPSFEPGF